MAFRLATTLLLLANTVLGQSGIYQQCGGIGWYVFTVNERPSLPYAAYIGLDQRLVFPAPCAQHSTIVCTATAWNLSITADVNLSDYSQCLPGSSTSSAPSTVPSTTSTAPSSTTSTTPPAETSVANISPEWVAAYTKVTPPSKLPSYSRLTVGQAKAAVVKLSLTDKVNLGTGVQWQKGPCVGNTPALASVPGFNGLCLQGTLSRSTVTLA